MVAKSNKAVSNSVLGQMIAWVDEGGLVPVQQIEAPKGAYVLTSDEFGSVAELIDNVLIAEDDAFKADLGMQNSGLALAKALGTDPTYAKWESFRMAYERGYLSRKKNASEDSANLSWGRLVKRMTKETGLEKPKAPSKVGRSVGSVQS
jgi:hypothetical protein